MHCQLIVSSAPVFASCKDLHKCSIRAPVRLIKKPRSNLNCAFGSRPVVRTARTGGVHVSASAATAVVGTPPQYGWLMISVAFTAAIMQWLSIRVMQARKAAGVEYPKMTADGNSEAENKFNCAQRAHHNAMETLPQLLVIQLLVAQVYPIAGAVIGTVWAVGRIVYAIGYGTGDPNKRLPGSAVSTLTVLAAALFLGFIGVNLVRA